MDHGESMTYKSEIYLSTSIAFNTHWKLRQQDVVYEWMISENWFWALHQTRYLWSLDIEHHNRVNRDKEICQLSSKN